MYEHIGRNLRNCREGQGLSRETLSEYSDVSGNHIGLIERSVKVPKIDTLYKLCKALKVSIFDILLENVKDDKNATLAKINMEINQMSANELHAVYELISHLKQWQSETFKKSE